MILAAKKVFSKAKRSMTYMRGSYVRIRDIRRKNIRVQQSMIPDSDVHKDPEAAVGVREYFNNNVL